MSTKPPEVSVEVSVDRAALKTLMEWCRDAIDFKAEEDEAAAKAYSVVVKPLMAELTPEEDSVWDFAFGFNAQCHPHLSEDAIAHLTWIDLCAEFPRLKEYMGCL